MTTLVRRRSLRSLGTLALWAVLCVPHTVLAAVDAALEPREITLGESAQLTITTSGNALQSISLPAVQGLQFRIVGQSRRVQMINGATLASTSTIVQVIPAIPGIFTIPGLTPKSQPLVLRVKPDNGSANAAPGSAPWPGGSAANRGSPGGSGALPSGVRLTPDGSAFVRLGLPKRDIYVGESVPVEIQVGMRAGFVTSLNGPPTLSSTDFTLDNLSHQPERTERTIDGKPFTILTWHSVISPIKQGAFSLTVDTPLTVRIRTQSPRESMLDDMLGDPFLQNFFGTTVSKEVHVTSPPTQFNVLALPTDGRPADFSGAVGSFKIASDLSSKTTTAGDPLTLKMHVTGSGNFDRVDSKMLERGEQWKTYPPKASFKAAEPTGFRGEKTFEQPLIAVRPGELTVPSLAFSYFDPATKKYEIARSAPLNVSVAAASTDSNAGPRVAGGGPNPNPGPGAVAGLQADHAAAAARAASLRPLYFRPAFLAVPSLLTLAFTAGWLARRRRLRGPGSPRTPARAASKATLQVLQQLEAAAARGDTALFFNSARTALQASLAARWQVAPDKVTTSDVEARVSGDDDVREIFALSDEANYSGQPLTATDFDRWVQIVRRQLADGETA